jgi:RNA polymerase sigma factor (sigma-70 family)
LTSTPTKPEETCTEEELEALVEEGIISEQKALRKLPQVPRHRARGTSRDINQAYVDYIDRRLSEEAFYTALLRYVTTVVKSHSSNEQVFANIEDSIQNALLKLHKNLDKFDPRRSSFARYVTVVVLSDVRTELDAQKRRLQTSLDEAETLPAPGLSAEKQVLFKDWMAGLEGTDRTIARMLMDGLTQGEIGEALGIAQSAVSQRLERLRKGTLKPF